VARRKLAAHLDSGQVTLRDLTVTELDDAFVAGSFDCVAACLVFSELSRLEQDFTLRQLGRLLTPAGLVVIADEVVPRSALGQVRYHAVRFPMLAITYVLTQTTTRPVSGLQERLQTSGFTTEATRTHAGSYEVLVGRRLAVGSHA